MALKHIQTMISVAAIALSGTGAIADGLSDAEIIGIYSQVNSFDIETALLGEVMGQSEEVRALGEMVSNDHSGVRAGVHQLASELGIVPVLPPARIKAAMEHDKVIETLRAAGPDGFDEAYLTHEIAFHRSAIAAVEGLLLPEADAPELKAHFEAVLPAFEHHLHANIEAAEKLGVEIAK